MKKIVSLFIFFTLLISCGSDNSTGGNNNGGFLVGTLILPAQGVYGGQPKLQYNNKEYFIGQLSGQGMQEYNQVTNQMMTTMGSNSQSVQITQTVSFTGSFQQQQVWMGSGQSMQEVVIFNSIRLGTVTNQGGNFGYLKVPGNQNCGSQPTLVTAQNQVYSIAQNSSQQFSMLMNGIFQQQPHSFEGPNNCIGVFRVSYTGQVSGNTIMIQTISITN